MTKEKIRIGLLIEDYTIPNWAYHMLKSIINSSHSEILLVVKKQKSIKHKKSLTEKIFDGWKGVLFKLFMKFDKQRYTLEPNAFKKRKLSDLIHCTKIEIKTKDTDSYNIVHQDDIKKIKTFNIDVFIKLGFATLIGDILESAKFGIWSYYHGDYNLNRGGLAGVWEYLEHWNETGVTLQILNKNENEHLQLSKSYSCTDKFGIHRNRNNYYWKSLSFIPRNLQELHRVGPKVFFEGINKINSTPFFYYNRLYSSPKNWELFKVLLKDFWTRLKIKIQNTFYFNQWIILFDINVENQSSKSFVKFNRILPPKDRFWADPFIIFKNKTYYIFLEELIYKKNKGTISVIEMNEKGEYGQPKLVLEKDYHLSYPFIFEENGEYFMIPETKGNRTIELYKCIDFPLKWKLKSIIMDNVQAVDATIFKHDGKYWLFVNMQENPGASTWDELFLFFSDSLTDSKWKPHPLNPIVSDVKCARPAGNIFVHNKQILRPAQNCSKRYGYGMQLREITTLNENEYKEKQVQSIYPNWQSDLIATHTLNHVEKLTVIDAQIKRRK